MGLVIKYSENEMRQKQLPRQAYKIIREMLLSGHTSQETLAYVKQEYPEAKKIHVSRQQHRVNTGEVTKESETFKSTKIILDNQTPTPPLTSSDFEDIKNRADADYERIAPVAGVRPRVFSKTSPTPVKNNVLPPTGVEHWQFQSIKFTTRNGDTVEIHLTSQSMRDIVSNLLR